MTSSPPSPDASVPHGTLDGYTNHKCTCGSCRDAWAAYMAAYRKRNKLTINARRRAARRAAVMRATGEEFDFDAIVDEELRRNGLT